MVVSCPVVTLIPSSSMDTLRRIVETRDTRAGRIFDTVVLTFIVISMISFSIETIPDLSPTAHRALRLVEVVTVIAFTIEYLLRVLVARPRRRFVFSFFGLIDLLAILPFYVAAGIDLRSLRAFRILRLFRALNLMKYNAAIRRTRRAFYLAREEIVLFFSASLLLLFFAGAGIYFFENQAQPETFKSIFHSLWWAAETLTTVGYGDIYPVTVGGKIFTFFILMIGLGVVAVPSGLMASTLAEARRLEQDDRESPSIDESDA